MGEEGLGLDGCECVWMRKPERFLFIETLERERGRERGEERKGREGGWRLAGQKGFPFGSSKIIFQCCVAFVY